MIKKLKTKVKSTSKKIVIQSEANKQLVKYLKGIGYPNFAKLVQTPNGKVASNSKI